MQPSRQRPRPAAAAPPVEISPEAAAPARERFEDLLMPLLGPAYALARSLTRDAHEAEDLLQEAALAAFRGYGSFAPGTHFKAWFYRILMHCHFARYRRQRHRPATVDIDDVEDLYLFTRTAEAGFHQADDDPAALLMRKMTAEQVHRAVAGLPPEFRAAVSLFFLEDLTYEETATVLDCPLGTVRSRLHRGRKLLQKELWAIAREEGIVSRLSPTEGTAP